MSLTSAFDLPSSKPCQITGYNESKTSWLSLALFLFVTLCTSNSYAEHSARAQLISTDNSSTNVTTFQAKDAPNKLAAATAALNQCIAAHPNQDAKNGFCELTHSDTQPVSTSADLRSGDASKPHPLFLWRIESNTATVYLGGSIHILKPGLYPLAPQYQAAFDIADFFVTEVDASELDPQKMQFQLTRFGVLEPEQSLASVLPERVYADLQSAGEDYGLPMSALERFKPAYVTQQLAVMALLSVGYSPQHGMEQHFQQQLGDRQTLGLETVEFQLDLLLNQPLAMQTQMTRDTLTQLDDFEAITADLIKAWLYGNDEVFSDAFTQQSGTSEEAQVFLTKLLDDRNVKMVEKIEGYLNTQGNYFVLVGAAHFLGEQGIITLLQEQGINVQRIYSDQAIPSHP